ncbi:MAG: hypothetical protein EOO01_24685, partial [Chitinophagaceae bacterium]
MMQTTAEKTSGFNLRYLLLYIPSLISLALAGDAVTSYFAAWSGSFLIFYLSFTNKIKDTHKGVPLAEKIFRPVFLTQLIFAGYMSCSSVFYFLNLLGYEYFTRVPYKVMDPYEVSLAASCQRYYLLGHAAMVHGMLFFYSSSITSKYKVNITNWPSFFIKFSVVATPIAFVCARIGGLSQLSEAIGGTTFVASTIALALSIPLKKTSLTILAGIIFISNLLQALTSGYKEPVIVSFLMLGLFLYPFYKKLILTIFVPLMLLLFTVLPTYVNTFRAQSRGEGDDPEAAKEEAIKKVQESL